MKPQITFYLDQRRLKSGNQYPIKLRVWDVLSKKARLYNTAIDSTEMDFNQALTQKPKKEFLVLRSNLDAIKGKAEEIVNELTVFTFDAFERRFTRKTGSGISIIYHFEQIIEKMRSYDQIGTASNYNLSLKSLLKFNQENKRKVSGNITFYEITTDWLNDYENYMVKGNGKSYTTVSMYLRALRTVFNKAIAENEIKVDMYPFGNRKYVIPASKNTKKALNNEQLKSLLKSEPKNEFQQKAKDFWFFSFSCNGMNIKDIALLKYKDIQEGAVRFYRAKTITTTKGSLKPITAYLTGYAQEVIDKYGDANRSPENLVFDIIQPNSTAIEQKRCIQNFTRFINQHINSLCKSEGLPQISTYWARHSYATTCIRRGASMEMIQENLGHGNLNTTKNYFAGFEDETKKEFAAKLMEF
ncbi:MAG: site-specific integrase [Bacteroidia bacterium]|nr:site-specific integrase [Bacteroidota bacterium]MBP9081923.1 site-specific integrase [Bacteroidia bacterium]